MRPLYSPVTASPPATTAYDDYAGIDVKDKYVLILRDEPQENDPKSVFAGRDTTTHATFAIKAVNAKMHGARGVIIVNDAFHHPGERDALLAFGRADGPTDAGVFFVQVTAKTAGQWLKPTGKTLSGLIESIDKDLKPQSFEIPNLNVSLNVEMTREQKPASNVSPICPVKPTSNVIIGAH
ncbi:MAG: PA domain-containing protein [Acidobacteriota bacterium]